MGASPPRNYTVALASRDLAGYCRPRTAQPTKRFDLEATVLPVTPFNTLSQRLANAGL